MRKSKRIVKPKTDTSTEEKIKRAAKIIFHKKGYAATRTRDIAQEAGINLALLNYYFRSKEKLFDIIVFDSLLEFRKSMADILNNEKTSLQTKVEKMTSNYIDFLITQPNVPLFILSEIRNHPGQLVEKMNPKSHFLKTYFVKQFKQAVKEGKIADIDPVHYIINIIAMIVFPFVASPLVKNVGNMSDVDFNELMLQRKVLIPKWLKAISK